MKKFLIALVVLAMILSLAACGASKKSTESTAEPAAADPAADWPSKNINFYSAQAGGTVDVNFRALSKVLEPHLGVSIVNINEGTVVTQDKCLKEDPDGYSFCMMLIPDVFMYMSPGDNGQHRPEEFTMVANIISEGAALAVHPDDERFKDCNDLADFIAYAKANSNENILVAVGVPGNCHDITLRMLIDETGCKNLKIINTDGGISARKATFQGGHVDVYIGNVGDAKQLQDDGEAKILGIFADERSKFLPDTKTALECGINVVYGSNRGIACSKDVDPAIVQKFVAALQWAVEQPEYIELMDATGMETKLQVLDEYDQFVAEQKTIFEGIVPTFGW
ncbi:MAG: Bug family tripartite tricarboxylate transporter substrate binding protein [Christensenellales bacterium]|jgi:tripartite-type tricarboxylate transporter receptor subunit TctC